jgi:hypothetical protein
MLALNAHFWVGSIYSNICSVGLSKSTLTLLLNSFSNTDPRCGGRSPYIAYERFELTRWKTPLATPRVLLRCVIRLRPPATAINTRSKRSPTVVWRHLCARCIALRHAALRARYTLLRNTLPRYNCARQALPCAQRPIVGRGLSKFVTI